MKLTNMKVAPAESKEYNSELDQPDKPQYPYSLRLSLDADMLDRLGIKDLPAVGDKLSLAASAEVCCVSQYDSQEGGSRSSVDLQITDLGLEPESTKKDPADVLYPSGGDNT